MRVSLYYDIRLQSVVIGLVIDSSGDTETSSIPVLIDQVKTWWWGSSNRGDLVRSYLGWSSSNASEIHSPPRYLDSLQLVANENLKSVIGFSHCFR